MPEKRLVLLGGGHSHILLLKKLGMRPVEGLITSLVTPDATMIYTGMLPGAIMGNYDQEDIQVDLIKLANYANSRVTFDLATGLNLEEKYLILEKRNPLSFDMLSIDIGINYSLLKLKGFEEFVLPIKPFRDFIFSWERFLSNLGSAGQETAITLIGAGAAGCELALAINLKLKTLGHIPRITLLDRDTVAAHLPSKARKKLISYLNDNNVVLKENAHISSVSEKVVYFTNGEEIISDLTISTAGGHPHEWLSNTELKLEKGFVETSPKLQSISHDFVFASGDCAAIKGYPLQKAGVFAVRASSILYKNLERYLNSRVLLNYTPQKKFLQALTVGYKNALIFRGARSVSGYIPWLYKNFVDRSFLKKFSVSIPMNSRFGDIAVEETQPLCGACGAKVGGKVLEKVLGKLPSNIPEMTNRIGDDAAVLNLTGSLKVLTTDHLRKFCNDPWKMAKITAIHSLGDIWAMGADPVAVLSHITIPEGSPEVEENYLTEIMDAARGTFLAEGAQIVGGHTNKGVELVIGFTILGNVNDKPITTEGALPADKVVLTKPIGVGTILAGEMQGLSKGTWIKNAHDWMMQSQGKIARIIGQKATAMTDITGFGLAGHLMKICQESDLAVQLYLDELPILEGAMELASRGVRSTLFEENLNYTPLVKCSPGHIKWPLLFDPQTAGGLLASIPEKDVNIVISKLKEHGFCGLVVGEFLAGRPEIKVN